MIPLVGHVERADGACASRSSSEARRSRSRAAGVTVDYKFGTMIEIPRAALTADEIAERGRVLLFGTNDLTQMTLRLQPRRRRGQVPAQYMERGSSGEPVRDARPRRRRPLDARSASTTGRATRPDLKLGICGEHGGDPSVASRSATSSGWTTSAAPRSACRWRASPPRRRRSPGPRYGPARSGQRTRRQEQAAGSSRSTNVSPSFPRRRGSWREARRRSVLPRLAFGSGPASATGSGRRFGTGLSGRSAVEAHDGRRSDEGAVVARASRRRLEGVDGSVALGDTDASACPVGSGLRLDPCRARRSNATRRASLRLDVVTEEARTSAPIPTVSTIAPTTIAARFHVTDGASPAARAATAAGARIRVDDRQPIRAEACFAQIGQESAWTAIRAAARRARSSSHATLHREGVSPSRHDRSFSPEPSAWPRFWHLGANRSHHAGGGPDGGDLLTPRHTDGSPGARRRDVQDDRNVLRPRSARHRRRRTLPCRTPSRASVPPPTRPDVQGTERRRAPLA